MTNPIRFEDRIEGANNSISWNLRIMMLLDEHKVDSYVKDKRLEPTDEPENIPMD